MFDTLGTIFGFENMLVWGKDFPLDFSDFVRISDLQSWEDRDTTPRVVAGHLRDPTWPLPRRLGGDGRISWVTQIRDPREQLMSARRYLRRADPSQAQKLLAATLARVVRGEYEMVGVLGHSDPGLLLPWLLHSKWGLPYVIPTSRNSAASHLRDLGVEDIKWPSEYTPLKYEGHEVLEWWDMAMGRVRKTHKSQGVPSSTHQGVLPAIALPPTREPVFSTDWARSTQVPPEVVDFSSLVPVGALPGGFQRFVAMVRVRTADHEGNMRAQARVGTGFRNWRRLTRPLLNDSKRRPPSWARQDLFGLGSATSVLHTAEETWAGVAFSPPARGHIDVRIQAPASTRLEILSECLIFPVF